MDTGTASRLSELAVELGAAILLGLVGALLLAAWFGALS